MSYYEGLLIYRIGLNALVRTKCPWPWFANGHERSALVVSQNGRLAQVPIHADRLALRPRRSVRRRVVRAPWFRAASRIEHGFREGHVVATAWGSDAPAGSVRRRQVT